jgi:hypothetical protein
MKYYKLIRSYPDDDFFKVNVIYPENTVVPPRVWPLSVLAPENPDYWIEVFPDFKYGK